MDMGLAGFHILKLVLVCFSFILFLSTCSLIKQKWCEPITMVLKFKNISPLLIFIPHQYMSFTLILKHAVEHNTWNITHTLQHLQVQLAKWILIGYDIGRYLGVAPKVILVDSPKLTFEVAPWETYQHEKHQLNDPNMFLQPHWIRVELQLILPV
jgi:hypothetical protein